MTEFNCDRPKNLDAESFLSLLALHEAQIMGFIWSITASGIDAEDLFQQTLLTMWEKLATFESGSNFVGWACRIAKLKAFELNRRRRKGLLFDNDLIERLADEAGQDDLDFVRLRRQILSRCMAKLRDEDRALIQSCYTTDTSIKTVAEQMGRSVRAVYRSLGRIRKVLYLCVQSSLEQEA